MTTSWARCWQRTAHRSTIGAVVLGVAVIITTGCGSSSTASKPGAGDTSTTASTGGAPSNGGAPQTISLTGVQIQVPAGWRVSKDAQGVSADPPPNQGQKTPPGGMSIQSTPDPLGSTSAGAKTALDGAKNEGGKNIKRLPDAHVNGLTLYHVQYDVKGEMWDEYGTMSNGQFINIGWQFFEGGADGLTRPQADKLIQPVMATLKPTS